MRLPLSALPHLGERLGIGDKLVELRDRDLDDWLGTIGLRRARPGAELATRLALVAGGVALGAMFGLLFAPRSGRELRDRLRGDGVQPQESSRTVPIG